MPSQHRDLLAVPEDAYHPVDGIAGVDAYRTTKTVLDADRTIVVTRSQSFLAADRAGPDC